jgi:glyoxylase-like metal-dependent hydrolase (beta-lactamase superfamily II)
MLEGNCYLVKCDSLGHGVVIDPGDEAERISEEIRSMGLEPEAIMLTHGHFDHTNAAARLRKRFRCRVVCHEADAGLVSSTGEALWGIERMPCTVDQEVREGDRITVGGKEFTVIHTPGHSPGSVCYSVGDLLFTGDLLFRCGIGRTDLPGGSAAEMDRSLRERLAGLGGSTVVHPGHGPSTTIEDERRCNPFLER